MPVYDFYFGELYWREGTNQLAIPLYELLEKARISGAQHFTAQLRRVIKDQGHLIASDGTSAPPFPQFIQSLDTDQVSLVRIGGRTDVNENTGTLECTLIFVEGPLHVITHWCAWKELRAYEIISTLLVPLISSGLISRTVISSKGKDCLFPRDHSAMVDELFYLAGNPYSPVTHGEKHTYVRHIEKAFESASIV